MRASLERALFADFPIFFAEARLSARESCMGRGIACGDGWEPLIRRVAAAAERIRQRHGTTVVATQVKEKFGALRLYHRIAGTIHRDRRFATIVIAAENVSIHVCEVCGLPGALAIARGRVYRALCVEHLSRRAVAAYEADHAEPPRSLAEMVKRIGCASEEDAAQVMSLSAAYAEPMVYDPAHDYVHLPAGTQPGEFVPGFSKPPVWPTYRNPSPAGDEPRTP